MKKIVLISCGSKKLRRRAKAQDLYISPLFRLSLKYARKLNPDDIYILSAEHGFLDLDTEIEPYDRTLNGMRSSEVQAWAQRVLVQIEERADPSKDHFVLLAGQKYRKFLIPHLASYEAPMEGLGIGRQLQYLDRQIHE